MSNSEENNQEEVKNLTEYDKIWKEIREKIKVTAQVYVPQLYEALLKDGYTPKEARDRIKKDAFNIWKHETIDDHIPIEAKNEIYVTSGKQAHKIKREITALVNKQDERSKSSQDNGGVQSTEQPKKQTVQPTITEQQDDFYIPPNRFRKVFMGFMKMRQTGEQTGVYITMNWDVISE